MSALAGSKVHGQSRGVACGQLPKTVRAWHGPKYRPRQTGHLPHARWRRPTRVSSQWYTHRRSALCVCQIVRDQCYERLPVHWHAVPRHSSPPVGLWPWCGSIDPQVRESATGHLPLLPEGLPGCSHAAAAGWDGAGQVRSRRFSALAGSDWPSLCTSIGLVGRPRLGGRHT